MTQGGLKAMEELEKLEEELWREEDGRKKTEGGSEGGGKQWDVYVFDTEYLIVAVDPDECDCLSEPVWECESGGYCGAGNCGYGGEYAGGGYLL